jgi:UDP-N-acetylglucosamine 2-epimerase (non-hydrolysing)
MKITIVAGARPNFIKIAPIIEALETKIAEGFNIEYRLVHTGQHYDKKLSGSFFEELQIPNPDINLNVGSGSQAEQTAGIMIGFEKELIENPSDLVLVVGDVTSTMACSIVAKKLGVSVTHVEAGIRSGDLAMPEEINRMVTDSITDYFFTTSRIANSNLEALGVNKDNIYFVGNVMIDTLLKKEALFKQPQVWDRLQLKPKDYFVLTMHRPSNVDQEDHFERILNQIIASSKGRPIIFPVHPRTKKIIENLNLNYNNLHFVEPLGYLEFNYLVKHAFAVLTDSGGITEEATVLNVPCITFRDSTERPETCEIGTNVLVGSSLKKIEDAFTTLFSGKWKKGESPELWDGNASKRIVEQLIKIYNL